MNSCAPKNDFRDLKKINNCKSIYDMYEQWIYDMYEQVFIT